MEGHFTWFHWVPALVHSESTFFDYTEKFLLGIALGAVLLLVGKRAARGIQGASLESRVIPEAKLSLSGFFDLFVGAFVAHHDSVLGKENRQYLPLTGSIFLFIFAANLLGLVPGFTAITTTVWINAGIAIVAFIAFNFYGVREQGVVSYLKHFCGPIWILAPAIFCLEIFSISLRMVTLNLRLYWNIVADHLVLGTFTEMAPWGLPIVFYGLGTFVCFMQAFIFTTLTMVYILLATQHEEEH